MIPAEDTETKVTQLARESFNSSEGPLWRVRMMPSVRTDSDLPFKTNIFFVYHHSITDGFSSMRICGHFVNFLNDVLAGNSSNSLEQVCEIADVDSFTRKALLEVMKEYAADPQGKMKTAEKFRAMSSHKPLIFNSHPIKKKPEIPVTNTMRNDFNEATTKKFITKCKENSVSVHSAFFTLAEVALIDLMAEEGVVEENYIFPTYHVVNGRRYWDTSMMNIEKLFGNAILVQPTLSNLPKDAKLQYWSHVRKFYELFQETLKTQESLKYEIHSFMGAEDLKKLNIENIHVPQADKLPLPGAAEEPKDSNRSKQPSAYYDTNNMGDITKLVSGRFARSESEEELPHVRVSDIMRSTSTHSGDHTICSHVLQSLNGRLLHALDYNIKFMSSETAKKYIDVIQKVMLEVIEQ